MFSCRCIYNSLMCLQPLHARADGICIESVFTFVHLISVCTDLDVSTGWVCPEYVRNGVSLALQERVASRTLALLVLVRAKSVTRSSQASSNGSCGRSYQTSDGVSDSPMLIVWLVICVVQSDAMLEALTLVSVAADRSVHLGLGLANKLVGALQTSHHRRHVLVETCKLHLGVPYLHTSTWTLLASGQWMWW